jgi:dephospho-CoA kinase
MNSLILAFAGSIGSGKSTLAQGVADALSWPVASFGSYVREIARQQGREESREVLQSLGATLIAAGEEAFCQAVLTAAGWEPGQSLVIEGVRHTEVVTALRRVVAPTPLKLVYIAVAEDIRQARLQTRANADAVHLPQIDTHSTEIQVKAVLAELADLTVDGARTREELVEEIVHWMHQHT